MAGAAVLATALLSGGQETAAFAPAPGTGRPPERAPASDTTERHHYLMSARVRPLLLSWIGTSNVGEAVLTRTTRPQEMRYSVLIGTE